MFEDSLLMNKLEASASGVRRLTAVSFLLQGSVAALLITLPLLHPERLQLLQTLPKPAIFVPKRPVVVLQTAAPPPTQQTSLSLPSVARSITEAAPAVIHAASPDSAPPATIGPATPFSFGGSSTGLEGITTGTGTHGPAVTAAAGAVASSSHRPNISSGVAAGMLLAPIRPVYPQIAALSHTEGVVVVEALISRRGTIEQAHVVSGPALLRQAALEAVSAARYRPFLLNGTPTEVQTTVTINFRLGGSS